MLPDYFGVWNMNILLNVAFVVQILSALVMTLLILLQHGKGADMGAAFGSGASGSLFGATGSANVMSRATGALAAVFFISTLALAFFGNKRPDDTGSVLEGAVQTAPAAASSAASDAIPTGGAPAAVPAKATAPASAEPVSQVPAK
jgi:preprotein translocase subunit SecG